MAEPSAGLIAKGMHVKGEVTGGGSLVVEGELDGAVNLDRLTVQPHGIVRADVDARAVIVLGRVEGNIDATDRIDVKSSATVFGDVRAPTIVIEEGAEFRGNVHMDIDDSEAS